MQTSSVDVVSEQLLIEFTNKAFDNTPDSQVGTQDRDLLSAMRESMDGKMMFVLNKHRAKYIEIDGDGGDNDRAALDEIYMKIVRAVAKKNASLKRHLINFRFIEINSDDMFQIRYKEFIQSLNMIVNSIRDRIEENELYIDGPNVKKYLDYFESNIFGRVVEIFEESPLNRKFGILTPKKEISFENCANLLLALKKIHPLTSSRFRLVLDYLDDRRVPHQMDRRII